MAQPTVVAQGVFTVWNIKLEGRTFIPAGGSVLNQRRKKKK